MDTIHQQRYQTFSEFYPYYLSEHSNSVCRELHFVGSTLALICLCALMITGQWWFLPLALVSGYGFAWTGHFFFEKNRPATFKYPLYSFMGDWVMYWQMLAGQVAF